MKGGGGREKGREGWGWWMTFGGKWEVGRYGCQFKGLGEADTMKGEGGREERRETNVPRNTATK